MNPQPNKSPLKRSGSSNASPPTSKTASIEKVNDQNGNGNGSGSLYTEMMAADPFWSTVSGSSWRSHLRSVLVSAMCIVSMVDTEGASVLVHCSDGWDRTSQLCAVAQILLDPYFRSIRGLCCLIEKEWASFGHKFRERFVVRIGVLRKW